MTECPGSGDAPFQINTAHTARATARDFGECRVCHQSVGLRWEGSVPFVLPHKPMPEHRSLWQRLRERIGS